MKNAIETRIIKGRPFGGTGFLYNKKFANCLKPLHNYVHERVTVMKLESESYHILLINVYFPYFNTCDQAAQMAAYRDTLGFVENVMSDNPNCKYIILADFNCNLNDVSHPYTQLIRDSMTRFNLVSCYDV